MNNKFLITTALQETFPQNKDEEVIFLGEWCRTLNTKNIWQQFNSKTIPYHWDNREKFYSDYQEFLELYEKILVDLSFELNKIHGVKFDSRYWRILVGPWLADFMQILFDRYIMLQSAFKDDQSYELQAIDRKQFSCIPNDMQEFYQVFATDDWNESVYVQLIELCWPHLVEINWVKKTTTSPRYSLKKRLKMYFKDKILPTLNGILTKEDDVFFIESYLPLKTLFKLQLQLGQRPAVWKSQSVPVFKVNPEQRNWDIEKESVAGFEKVVREMIPNNIPTVYLEGYSKLCKKIKKLHWPKNPKSIFTSNSAHSDDIFKAWAAIKTKNGSQLIIGQHGGHYGTGLFSAHEDHEIKIADSFLSWGWSDKTRSNIKPIGNIKSFGLDVDYNPKGGALMVEMTLPRYSHHMMAIPVAGQLLEYFDDQKIFLSSLPLKLRKQITLRLSRTDYGWNQAERWKESMPEVQLDKGLKDIKLRIRKSRLYISTYNATTFLESMTWNIPTIIFWNKKHWELNDQARPYFELLEKAGIFHSTPQSAAKKMIDIWDDVDNWWHSKEIQKVKETFIHQYAKVPNEPLKALEEILRKSN
jgi:putative transferase (TIGR04331 family)